MASKKTTASKTKKYDLSKDEQRFINAMRAVDAARKAKEAYEAAVADFEEAVDDFKYNDEDDDGFF